ncbi:IS66 family insertion sequence element accessory protein TnpA [Peribacillus loiseleuriae]
MWQARIEAFKANEESSVSAWCSANDISVQSMYTWLNKSYQTQTSESLPF